MLNIPKTVIDPFYRYRRPISSVKIEKGKTLIVNSKALSKSLDRDILLISKYLGQSLSTNVVVKDDMIWINGRVELERIEDKIESFIEKYVICSKDDNPETIIQKDKKGLCLVCKACGSKTILPDDKVTKYMI
ncbi:Eukaryotic translation initiation factor eIF2B-eIF5 [Orpheovirus IHUMI-LCC2]|uniref:Eukaryotic translation initiation factor eIF2B-eIF5 n=1 Tax=Orpheovirus IHUMI-LCC2 TaxID=2023057 RepID=A0A2I2L5P9_9VIRU|nr:Eukaryotic translation initiation factor eIF2B-eIF5 [Orpheovirus IHUMI-LCC2]SNW62841.1 Eukaryotic translation initiation factor eIF2B-eIF5 [Orpheovirus IHUMI-LCC2]